MLRRFANQSSQLRRYATDYSRSTIGGFDSRWVLGSAAAAGLGYWLYKRRYSVQMKAEQIKEDAKDIAKQAKR